jgi:uncharacterized sodium:solute symporter family permease YidK
MLSSESVFAVGLFNTNIPIQPTKIAQKSEVSLFFDGGINTLWQISIYIVYVIMIFFSTLLLIKIIRFIFELYYSKHLRYLKITIPRSDSKLDKEKETKKDFKEKIGMMTMFYKAIHKLSEAGLSDTFYNFLFRHSKISLELVYRG